MIHGSQKNNAENILTVGALSVSAIENKDDEVLRKIDLNVSRGESIGIIGETGCGKTMTARAIMGLLPNGFMRISGKINLDGKPLHSLLPEQMRSIMGKEITFIPQNPAGALNPIHTIGYQFELVLKNRARFSGSQAKSLAKKWLNDVKLQEIDRIYESYPFQLSGGQNQRVAIALALAVNPILLIADEPTTALDSITRRGILELFTELQAVHNLTLLLISHDLTVVRNLCDKVAVMYAGEIVEYGPTDVLFTQPKHPYLAGLINSLPSIEDVPLKPLPGDIPSFYDLPSGCTFNPRCSEVMDKCKSEQPSEFVAEDGRKVHCFLMEK